MSYFTRKPRKVVIDHLNNSGHSLDSAKLTTIFSLQNSPNPWYIQAMLGTAAIASAVFLLIFLSAYFRYSEATKLITFGLLFSVLAIVGQRYMPKRIVISQLAIVFSIVGLFLFESGVAYNLYTSTRIRGFNQFISLLRFFAFTIILFELSMFVLHSAAIRRYIAIVNITIALLVMTHVRTSLMTFQLAYILLVVFTLLSWEGHSQLLRLKGHWQSVLRFAIPMMFLVLLLVTVSRYSIFYRLFNASYNDWWITTAVIAVVFIGLIVRIFSRLPQPNRLIQVSSIALIIVLAVLTYHSPGILGALFVLVLAYAHGHKILFACSLVFLAYFMGFYYYNMNISLLSKSISLMSIGAVLLFSTSISRYMVRRVEGGK